MPHLNQFAHDQLITVCPRQLPEKVSPEPDYPNPICTDMWGAGSRARGATKNPVLAGACGTPGVDSDSTHKSTLPSTPEHRSQHPSGPRVERVADVPRRVREVAERTGDGTHAVAFHSCPEPPHRSIKTLPGVARARAIATRTQLVGERHPG
jgi:hypothetical protein